MIFKTRFKDHYKRNRDMYRAGIVVLCLFGWYWIVCQGLIGKVVGLGIMLLVGMI